MTMMMVMTMGVVVQEVAEGKNSYESIELESKS